MNGLIFIDEEFRINTRLLNVGTKENSIIRTFLGYAAYYKADNVYYFYEEDYAFVKKILKRNYEKRGW